MIEDAKSEREEDLCQAGAADEATASSSPSAPLQSNSERLAELYKHALDEEETISAKLRAELLSARERIAELEEALTAILFEARGSQTEKSDAI